MSDPHCGTCSWCLQACAHRRAGRLWLALRKVAVNRVEPGNARWSCQLCGRDWPEKIVQGNYEEDHAPGCLCVKDTTTMTVDLATE